MAASAWKLYGPASEAILKGDLDLDSTFRVVLLTNAYTPNQSAHATFADISAAQVANGNGYATHGKPLSASAVSRTGLVNKFDGDDLVWSNSTITAKYAAIVQDANADGSLASTDRLLAFTDLENSGGSLSSSNADFAVGMDANGIFNATAA